LSLITPLPFAPVNLNRASTDIILACQDIEVCVPPAPHPRLLLFALPGSSFLFIALVSARPVPSTVDPVGIRRTFVFRCSLAVTVTIHADTVEFHSIRRSRVTHPVCRDEFWSQSRVTAPSAECKMQKRQNFRNFSS
jgi:hypothetical protein